MAEFIIGLLLGALIGREGLKGCCGCSVIFLGGIFILIALVVLLSISNNDEALGKIVTGLGGLVFGGLLIFVGSKILK